MSTFTAIRKARCQGRTFIRTTRRGFGLALRIGSGRTTNSEIRSRRMQLSLRSRCCGIWVTSRCCGVWVTRFAGGVELQLLRWRLEWNHSQRQMTTIQRQMTTILVNRVYTTMVVDKLFGICIPGVQIISNEIFFVADIPGISTTILLITRKSLLPESRCDDGTRCFCTQVCRIQGTEAEDKHKIVIIASVTSASSVLILLLVLAALLHRNRRYKQSPASSPTKV